MSLSLQQLEERGSLRSFDEVRQGVAERAAQRLPDSIVELKSTTITENLNMRVPGLGILELTDWAKYQMGSALGIKWDKWFGIDKLPGVIVATSKEIQEELTRRFNRLDMSRMIRSRRHPEGEIIRSDGVLEAFLSPTYQTIDDERVFDRLARRFSSRMDDLRVLDLPVWVHRGDYSWAWGTDRTSHYTFLTGETFELGEDDMALAGLHLRNSEVGASSLTMDDFWLRLNCVNGLVVRKDDDRLLHRQHRWISDDDIDGLLATALGKLERRHEEVLEKLVEARGHDVDDPHASLLRWLTARNISKKIIERVQDAYDEEPLPNRFGLVQAITQVARDTRHADRRMELEQLAGRFLLQGRAA
jgi:hypothetical protein